MSNVRYESDKKNMKFFMDFMFVLFILLLGIIGGYYYYQNYNENSSKQKKIAKANVEATIQTATALEEAGRYQEALDLINSLDDEYKDMAIDILIKLDADLYDELVGAVRNNVSKGRYLEAFDCVEKSTAGTKEQKKSLFEDIASEYWSYMKASVNKENIDYENKLTMLTQMNSNYFDDATYREYQQVYNTVKEGYVQEVLANVQSIDGNKEEQLRILQKGCQLLENEQELVLMRDEIQAEVDEEVFEKAENEIGESYKAGGYPAAIEKARELSKANPRVSKIKELEDEYVNRYTEKTLEDIDSIYKASGVGDVVATLQSVYNITNDSKIKNEISLWQNRTSSVKLTDIEPFHREELYISEKAEEDNWGNTYGSHFYVSDFRRSGYVEYNVKNIDEPQLQFVYYVPSHEALILSEGDSEWKYMSAKVYGDDMEIWSNDNANQKMEPQLVRLDVSKYSIVKIYISGVNDSSMYTAWSCHIGDMQFCW